MARLGADAEEVIRCLEQDFATVSLIEGEHATTARPMPSKQASERLRQMVKQQFNNHEFYVDIIARKL